MNEIVKDIAYIGFVIILALLSYYVIPYVRSLTSDYRTQELLLVIEKAVQYAEQKISGEKKGREKYNAVQMYVTNWLNDKGIKISEKELEVLIESAVYAMNNFSVLEVN